MRPSRTSLGERDANEAQDGSGFARAVALGALALLVFVSLATLLCLVLHQQGFTVRFGHEPMRALIGPGLALGACLLGPRRLGTRPFAAIVTVALAATWLVCRVPDMGDSPKWRTAMTTNAGSLAEPGSTFVYRLLFLVAPSAVDFVPPCLGVLATLAWLRSNARAAASPSLAQERLRLAALAWLSSGLMTAFFQRYVEQSQMGVPLFVMALGNLRGRRAGGIPEAGEGTRSLLRFGLWLGAAGFMHLHFLGFAPAAFVLCMVQPWSMPRRLATGVAFTLLPLLLAGCGVLGAQLTGFDYSVSSFHGGLNGQLWLPLTTANGWFEPGTLLAPDRVAMTAGILWFAVPAWFLAMPRIVWIARGAAARGWLAPLLPATAYVVLVSGFEFDLGWPYDLDLMVASSPALLWFVLEALDLADRSVTSRRLLLALLVPVTICQWLLITPMVQPSDRMPGQSNSAAACLVVNEVVATEGPVRIARPRPGERVSIALQGEPGAKCQVLRGHENQGFVEFPYNGSLDIAFVGRPEEWPTVLSGTIGADGWFRGEVTWDDTEQGANVGWQGMVQAAQLRFSAAFYFTAR